MKKIVPAVSMGRFVESVVGRDGSGAGYSPHTIRVSVDAAMTTPADMAGPPNSVLSPPRRHFLQSYILMFVAVFTEF